MSLIRCVDEPNFVAVRLKTVRSNVRDPIRACD